VEFADFSLRSAFSAHRPRRGNAEIPSVDVADQDSEVEHDDYAPATHLASYLAAPLL
jgi:hypothetical protein